MQWGSRSNTPKVGDEIGPAPRTRNFWTRFFKTRESENVVTFGHPLATFVRKGTPGALRDHVETIRRKKNDFGAFFRRPRSVSVRDCCVWLP
jgi:hypothetical protein